MPREDIDFVKKHWDQGLFVEVSVLILIDCLSTVS